MALPKREYYYLPEVAQKLEITEFDLQYYLSHGQILGSVWLNEHNFLRQSWDAFKDGYTEEMLCPYEGYVTLSSNECREIFTVGHICRREFYIDPPDIRLTLPVDQPEILIQRSGLMVSVWDLEFFAEQYCSDDEGEKNNVGRPSIMPQILEEYARRIKANEAYKHKSQEAIILYEWAKLHFKDQAVPKRDTIRNALGTFKPNSNIRAA